MQTVDLDFDPFESEEEYVLEESEQLSAIESDVCGRIVDKIIGEGFSDIDSDVAANLETQHQMMTDEYADSKRTGGDGTTNSVSKASDIDSA